MCFLFCRLARWQLGRYSTRVASHVTQRAILTADGNGTQPPPHTDAIWPAAFDYIIFNLNMAEAGAGPSAGVSVVGEVWTSDIATGRCVIRSTTRDRADAGGYWTFSW